MGVSRALEPDAARAASPPRRSPWGGVRRNVSFYLMFLPALLLLIGAMYPFVLGVITSLTNTKLYIPTVSFVGFKNYVNLFQDDVFLTGLAVTLTYTALVLLIQIPLGILVALLLDVPTPLRRLFRTTLVLPLLIPPIVAALMWKTMMQPASGVLNYLLGFVGLGPFPWLTSTQTALLSVALIDTWVYMPFAALILLAGLQSVPDESVEAALVDGASGPAIFRYVKLPWILPYILLVTLFRTADSLKVFDLIYPTTRGGPLDATRVLHVMAYEEVFRWSTLGKAMAIIMVLWLISYIVSTLLMNRWQRQSEAFQDGV
jgi:multiple sugar transport system permease protein